MKIYKLSKQVLSFQNNAAQFLNGLTSNSVEAPQNAFVNLHGRIIATFDQIKLNEEGVIVVMEENFVDAVLQHLDRYIRLSGIKVERLEKNTYFDLQGDADADWVVPQKKGIIIVTSKEILSNVTDEEFTLFRVGNNIPWLGIDYKDEFLLNVSGKDFVSFTKGCYLGQEPVAKVYNRSKPSWKLVVKSEADCSEEEKQKMTSKIFDPMADQFKGFVFIKND